MKTTVQEIIQWTLENAFNIEDQAGVKFIAIDFEEMREKFDEWLEKEKKQHIDFHLKTVKVGIKKEGDKLQKGDTALIRESAKEVYKLMFDK